MNFFIRFDLNREKKEFSFIERLTMNFDIPNDLNKRKKDFFLNERVIVDFNHHIGFIVGIIRLKETKEIKFIMNEADVFGYDSFSLDRTPYINDLLIHAVMPTPRRTVSINYHSIKEKVAYQRDENSTSHYVFHFFPNLLEST